MKSEKLVSVIVPVFNMEGSLEKCIGSILNQTYKHLEVILVDDGSQDRSYQVCKTLCLKDSRVRCFHTDNFGAGHARNYGIDRSTGSYLYFPDADDDIKENALEILVELATNTSSDIVVFGYDIIDKKGNVVFEKNYQKACVDADDLRNDYSECMGKDDVWSIQGAPWNKFFSASLIKDNNVRFPDLRRHQDEVFISRSMCYSKRIAFCEEKLYVYYQNDLSKEWLKYPINYIDSVIGLYNSRKETVLTWNTNNKELKSFVEKEYICNSIRAMELCFAPKFNMNKKTDRQAYIAEVIEKAQLTFHDFPEQYSGMKYQRCIANSLSDLDKLYMIMCFKVYVQKYFGSLFDLFRKI